jgi:uncharacterized protein YebE (UPF0316 family)
VTRENVIFLFIVFSLVGLVTLLKNLNVINNTVFLFALGLVLGTVIPFVVKKKQRKIQQEDRP